MITTEPKNDTCRCRYRLYRTAKQQLSLSVYLFGFFPIYKNLYTCETHVQIGLVKKWKIAAVAATMLQRNEDEGSDGEIAAILGLIKQVTKEKEEFLL